MKAAAMYAENDIRYDDVADPKIEGDRDVIVRVGAAGVCQTDLHTLQGQLAEAFGLPEAPYVLGHENAGWIEETASGVSDLEEGQPVLLFPQMTCRACLPCRRGHDMHCERPRFPGVDAVTWGGFSEYMRTSADCVVPLPAGADVAAFAPYADAGITAYHAINRVLPQLRPSSTVVVIGIGGLGQFAVQLLRLLSLARIVAVDLSDEKAARAKDLGAHHVVASRNTDPGQAVDTHTAGRGADVVLDLVGDDDSPSTALRLLRKGGTYSIVGYGGQLQLDTLQATVRELTVVGNLVGTYDELVDLVGLNEHGLHSEVELYELSEAEAVFQQLENGQIKGRAVLVP